MTPKLKQYLNRTILVAIPSIFKHGRCHPYTLRAVEEDGLWLASDELLDRLHPERKEADAANQLLVYVPNAHISAVILPALSATTSTTPAKAKETQTRAPAALKSASTTKPDTPTT
jgi:hypothetical protein